MSHASLRENATVPVAFSLDEIRGKALLDTGQDHPPTRFSVGFIPSQKIY